MQIFYNWEYFSFLFFSYEYNCGYFSIAQKEKKEERKMDEVDGDDKLGRYFSFFIIFIFLCWSSDEWAYVCVCKYIIMHVENIFIS